jgi:hypothetical protein
MSKIFILFLFLFNLLGCTQHHSIDLIVNFSVNVIDNNNKSIDSAKIEVTDIKCAGHGSMNSFIGKIYYSDKNGDFRLILPGGVEWDEHSLSDEKTYTKYIKSATIKISKALFRDTIVTFENTDYEKSRISLSIVLESN